MPGAVSFTTTRSAAATAALALVVVGAVGACGADQGQADTATASAVRSTPAATTGAPASTSVAKRGARSVGGSAGVDGGEGTSPKGRLRDLVEVDSVGVAMREVKITWLSGVHFELPSPLRKAARGILISVTIADDSAKGIGGDGEGAAGDDETGGYTQEVRFAIPPQAKRFPVTLQRLSGSETVSVALQDGRNPSIAVSGLPANTVGVQYTTTSAAGAKLIRANEDCSKSPEPQRPRVTGAYVDGASFDALLPDQTAVFCNGGRR
ncbi:MAG: hypothetical protein Q7T55_08700 [Solirubrobacteraceae bacterium]|nr:hypothetical protein [Solirubrobacteraceae bacterium]